MIRSYLFVYDFKGYGKSGNGWFACDAKDIYGAMMILESPIRKLQLGEQTITSVYSEEKQSN